MELKARLQSDYGLTSVWSGRGMKTLHFRSFLHEASKFQRNCHTQSRWRPIDNYEVNAIGRLMSECVAHIV